MKDWLYVLYVYVSQNSPNHCWSYGNLFSISKAKCWHFCDRSNVNQKTIFLYENQFLDYITITWQMHGFDGSFIVSIFLSIIVGVLPFVHSFWKVWRWKPKTGLGRRGKGVSRHRGRSRKKNAGCLDIIIYSI